MLLCASLLIGLSGCKAKSGAANNAMNSNVPARPQAPVAPVAPQMAPLPAGGVKAIYLTGWTAGGSKHFQNLIGLVDRTTINAMVIDVKDDGDVTYQADVPLAKELAGKMDGNMKQIRNIDRVLETLKKHEIFPIARLTCFRDSPLGNAHPELAVHDKSGKVWHDRKRHAWLNPYKKENWDYNVDLALDALKHGFKEIQFDYVRFPTDGKMSDMVFPGEPKDGMREDQIAAFLKYAHEKIHAAGGWFSADVFGLTSMVKNDEGIGQKFVKVVQNVDYLCPMVYPSHYAKGEYHIPNPNTEPYKIIHLSVGDAQKRLATVKTTCKLRPWIQDFSLYGVHYGPAQVKAQIKALEDLGIHEYLLWNAGNHFTEAALSKDPEASKKMFVTPSPASPGMAPEKENLVIMSGPPPVANPAGATASRPVKSTAGKTPAADASLATPDAPGAAKKQ